MKLLVGAYALTAIVAILTAGALVLAVFSHPGWWVSAAIGAVELVAIILTARETRHRPKERAR